ncbi:MAG: hypothetical protein KF723_03940 [Rhizobiaceae bacterium]|nr:hypothetical protein [Rhizobiaceae bacterium]
MTAHTPRTPQRALEGESLGDGEEQLVRRAVGLALARQMRDAIAMAADLLARLEATGQTDPDAATFQEMAGLFRDIADFAASGEGAALHAAGMRVAAEDRR